MSDTATMEDRELVRLVLAGQASYFDILVERYEARIFQYLLFRTPSREDAEDLTQKTFINVYRNLKKYKPAYPFRAWIYTIARNLSISLLRTLKPQVNQAFDLTDELTPSHELTDQEQRSNLWLTVRGELPENQSTALWLAYKEDLPLKEVARVMEKSLAHVKVLVHRGRKTLAVVLAETQAEVRPPPLPERRPAFADIRFSNASQGGPS